jgi:hypothetical protein
MEPTAPERLPDVVMGCLEACRRCQEVVATVVEQAPSSFPAVGPHLRHCVDHFHLLLDGWRAGSVNYDARARDPRLERDPEVFGRALGAIAGSLAAIRAADLERPLTVIQSAAPGRPPLASPSRLDRELAFLSGHTIHHIAIMVHAARAAGVDIPERLGIAFSTELTRERVPMKL